MLTLTSPVETPFHRLRAGVKLALLCGFTLWLFAAPGLGWLLASLGLVGLLYLTGGRVFIWQGVVMLRPLWPFVAVVMLWHGWIADWAGGAAVVVRLLAALAAANLVTTTTGLAPMIAVVEWLARPFAHILPPRRLALAIALVIRFVPVIGQNADRLSEAWRARSARRVGWRVLAPLALSAIDEADRVAEALRARGGVG